MEIRLPIRDYHHNMDWEFIDSYLDRFIENLPDYMSKRQFRIELAKRLGIPHGNKQSEDERIAVKRLMLRAIRTKKIRSDPQRWRMLIIEKPQNKMITH